MTTVHTIGHSTRPIEEFITLLTEHGIDTLVDIRTVPRSRHNPQFNRDALPGSLAAAGIDYRYEERLGGLRHSRTDSPNTGWRNASFRGYADHMQTEVFAEAVHDLLALATEHTVAIMCAEAVPWRCHRSLVGDALLIRGVEVLDIMGPGKSRAHPLTRFAHVEGLTITYPPEPGEELGTP